MIVGFSFSSPTRSQIGELVLDILDEEEIDLPGEVTKLPVETGSEVSDHIFIKADGLKIKGQIASGSGVLFDFSGTTGITKLVDAVEQLRELRAARELITVTTGLTFYDNMGIGNLKISRRGNGEGNWLSIDMELTEVKTVKLRTAEVPAGANTPTGNRTGNTNTPAGRSTPLASGGEQFGPFRPTSMAARLADTAATSSPTSILGQGANLLGGR